MQLAVAEALLLCQQLRREELPGIAVDLLEQAIARYLAELVVKEHVDLRGLAGDGAQLATALGYPRVLMPFYSACDQYELPWIWASEDVDRRLPSNELLQLDSAGWCSD